jgi:hypothetical protein
MEIGFICSSDFYGYVKSVKIVACNIMNYQIM